MEKSSYVIGESIESKECQLNNQKGGFWKKAFRHGKCYPNGNTNGPVISWNYIIPTKKYDFENRTFDNKDNYGIAK